MRYLVFGDVHWSTYSSIIRSNGDKYSTRLEYLINTLNWIESLAKEHYCNAIVGLGDFFDRCDLTSQEISALSEIKWSSNIPHYLLVGNHEMGNSDLSISSSHIFKLLPEFELITSPTCHNTSDAEIIFLPYILEADRLPLKEYIPTNRTKQRVIFSHNDISGIQMGKFISQSGFSINEIEDNCDLFINGHLHNHSSIGDKIINLGNISGQNFGEDAFTYPHQVMILDTGSRELNYYENPYAFNFYKLDVTEYDNPTILNLIAQLKNNSIITIKCKDIQKDYINDIIKHHKNIIEHRLIVDFTQKVEYNNECKPIDVDHLSKFVEYIQQNLGESDIITSELEFLLGR